MNGPTLSISAALRILLWQRALSWRNAIRFAPRLHRRIGAAFALGGAVLFVLILVAASALFAGVRQVAGAETFARLADQTVFFLFLFLLAGAVPFVSATLLAPGDLPLLASAPVRPAAIVAARLLDAVVAASGQFVVIGVPLLLALAWVVQPAWWGWLALAPLLVLFLALPPLAVAALLLFLARVVGLRRVRAAVALASAALAVAMCLLTVGAFSRQAGQITMTPNGGAGSGTVAAAVSGVQNQSPSPPLLPSAWVRDALLALGDPSPVRAATPFALLCAVTALVLALCLGLGGPVLVGEALLEGDGDNGNNKLRFFDRLLAALPLTAPVQALLAKDARYIVRDLVLLSQIGIPVILYFVPFVIAGQARASGAGAQDLLFLSVGIVATIAYMETSILGLSSVGLEGRAFWLLLVSPVSSATLIRAKWLGAWASSVLLCVPLFVIACAVFGAPVPATLAGAGVLALVCAALCGLAVGIAGLFPRFIYENPAHRASLSALVWGFVGATIYVIVATVLLGGALFLAQEWPERAAILVSAGITLFLLISLLFGLAPLAGAIRRLRGYAWED